MVKVLFQKTLEKGYCGLLNRMRTTGDIQFFVCRSRIIPEPLFPSQGIAGSGNEIGLARKMDFYWTTSASAFPCFQITWIIGWYMHKVISIQSCIGVDYPQGN